MPTLSNAVFAYTLNALWLLPLLVLAAEAIARLASGMWARTLHRLWQICLLLSLALPCLSFLRQSATDPFGRNMNDSRTHDVRGIGIMPVPNGAAPANASGVYSYLTSTVAWRLKYPPLVFMRMVCLLYAATVLFALLRLAWGLWQTRCLMRSTQDADLPQAFADDWIR